MNRLSQLIEVKNRNEGILSCSTAPNGAHNYYNLLHDVHVLVKGGIDQLLLIFSQEPTMRVASIAPAEVKAVRRGVKDGNYIDAFFDSAKAIRKEFPDLPIVVSGIVPDIIAYGMGRFIKGLEDAGVDAIDFPVYQCVKDPYGLAEAVNNSTLSYIPPVNAGFIDMSLKENLEYARKQINIARNGEIFLVPGVSGSTDGLKGENFVESVKFMKQEIAKQKYNCPIIAIGGVATAKDANEMVCVAGCDGVHFSSAYLNKIEANMPDEEMISWLRSVKEAMKRK